MRNKMSEKELQDFLQKDINLMKSLNFSQRYIDEVTENTRKWSAIGFFSDKDDPYIARNASILLENQRLFNEQWPGSISLFPEGAELEQNFDYWVSQWKRMSIPLMRRVFGSNFIGYDLVSVQAVQSPQDYAYLFDSNGRLQTLILRPDYEFGTRRLPFKWETVKATHIGDDRVLTYKGVQYHTGLDAEAEMTAEFSMLLRDEFTREIIRDLAMNAGKLAVYEYKDADQVLSLIEGMSAFIGAKCSREATWVVTSPYIANLLEDKIKPVEDSFLTSEWGVRCFGTLNDKWKIFVDKTAPSGNILLGVKDYRNPYYSGYVYCPYIPVNVTPAWRTDRQESSGQVMARYAKRLVNHNFYGAIKIENLPDSTPLSAEAESEE